MKKNSFQKTSISTFAAFAQSCSGEHAQARNDNRRGRDKHDKTREERACRETLVREYLPLVRKIAYRVFAHTFGRVDFEDLIGWGTTGLLEALDRFEEGGKASRTTYAYYRIHGAMLDGIGHIAPLSRAAYRKKANMPNFNTAISRVNPFEDVADPRTGVSPENCVAQTELRNVLLRAIEDLPAKQKSLVIDHYFSGHTLEHAGKRVGISKSWASRSHKGALEKLREGLERDHLDMQLLAA